LANNGVGTPFSKVLEQYSALQLEEEFAKNAYQEAQQGLAIARADAARQQSYLVDFAPPYLPDKASFTIPVLYTFTVFVSSLVLFGIGSLIAGAFRHQVGL
jgi:capsular polysaccharide transport system permease protein